MAKVKEGKVLEFPEGNLYIKFYSDDNEGYGVELDGEESSVADWSFGFDQEMLQLSYAWYNHIIEKLENNNGKLPEEIENITLYYSTDEMCDLADLDKVKELLEWR